MNAPDPSTSPALSCLSALRTSRSEFFASIVDHATKHAPAEQFASDGSLDRKFVSLLRNEGAAQIAEFLYLIEELGLKDAALFRNYILSHNDAMDGYLADPARMRAIGVTPQRIKAAKFTDERIAFLEFVSPPGDLYLDQASIGRLLTEVMAPESCRKTIIALAEGGLLHRHEVGQVLIASNGVLEVAYGQYLNRIVDAVKGNDP